MSASSHILEQEIIVFVYENTLLSMIFNIWCILLVLTFNLVDNIVDTWFGSV